MGLIMAAEAFTVRTESNIVNQLDDIAQWGIQLLFF